MILSTQFTPRHYLAIAYIHIENLDQGFLARLGPVFLSEMYRALDHNPETVLIAQLQNDEVIGFVSGGHNMSSVYKNMMLRIWVWGLPLAVRLLSIKRIKRILDIIKYGQKNGEAHDLPSYELYSIAVKPAFRGHGISSSLYEALANHFKSKDILAYKIIVGNSLLPAHRFYTKMGAKPYGEVEVHAGEKSTILIQSLTD